MRPSDRKATPTPGGPTTEPKIMRPMYACRAVETRDANECKAGRLDELHKHLCESHDLACSLHARLQTLNQRLLGKDSEPIAGVSESVGTGEISVLFARVSQLEGALTEIGRLVASLESL